MAYLGADSFGNNDPGGLGWFNQFNGVGTSTTHPYNDGYSIGPFGNTTIIGKTISTNENIFWFYYYFLGAGVQGIWFCDGANAQVTVEHNGWNVNVRTGGGTNPFNYSGALLGSAPSITPAGGWNHFAWRFQFNNTTGSVRCHLNGNVTPVASLNLTNVNTRGGSTNNYINRICAGSAGNGGDGRMTSIFYHNEVAGDGIDSYQGEIRASTRAASTAGNSADFPTRVGAASNHLANSQIVPDADTSYVESNVVGHQDLYTPAALGYTPTRIVGIKTYGYMRKSDAGARTSALKVRSAATEITTAANASIGQSYTRHETMLLTDPATGTAWAPAVALPQVGPKVEA